MAVWDAEECYDNETGGLMKRILIGAIMIVFIGCSFIGGACTSDPSPPPSEVIDDNENTQDWRAEIVTVDSKEYYCIILDGGRGQYRWGGIDCEEYDPTEHGVN